MRNIIGAACLCLAACSTPQEDCVARAERNLNGLDAAIAVAEANIARGFALEQEVVVRNGIRFCAGSAFGGSVRLGLSTCSSQRVRTIQTPVPLDIKAEERKLASMRARRPAERERTDRAVAACFAGGV